MTMSKFKVGLGVIIVAGAAIMMFLQYQTQQQLRGDNESLRQQIAQLKADNENAANPSATSNNSLSNDQLSELLKLRGEVTALRNQTNQLAKLQDQNQQLREAITAAAQERPRATSPEAEQQKAFGILEMNTSKQLVLGMIIYADEHQDQFPTNFDQTMPYFKDSEFATNRNRFEMVYTGSSSAIANPSSAIVLREIQPWTASGHWMRTYSFADGHSEVHRADPNGSFDEWEQQHVPVLKNQ